ncbi:Regulator of V-ATPase in vacuolar membrane protein 1 [Grifola frondosa]|uniref:Regulator of V-ATPase in vacuolar membrane protein 1 n=1 Tax=Grifola frondosa TaxID=5627 RepID=A0A1C7MQA9_GRIFR|nr:Regulator of V-ATPase in vacuolar membrane protein 1 [Grifola frondosa]
MAHKPQKKTRGRRMREITEEGWDLFLRVLGDGSLVVQAIANIDRRPPTLLKQFTLLQSAPAVLRGPPEHLYVLPNPDRGSLLLVTSPPLASYELAPLPFFDARADGLKLLARGIEQRPIDAEEVRSEIMRFVRTPDGEGVGVLRADGSGETWGVGARSKLVRRGRWKANGQAAAEHLVVLGGGKHFVTYSSSTLTLHSTPPVSLTIPPILSLFSLPSTRYSMQPAIVGITTSHTVLVFSLSLSPDSPSFVLLSNVSLPLSRPPKLILPVDPMAWSGHYGNGIHSTSDAHDVLLSVSEEGELAFWCTGRVRTGRTGLRMAGCSSAKKSVLVVSGSEGDELTIWDSKESEFASGLEYRQILNASDPVNDLDWSATPDNQSILAVGFAHRVELLCQQRMTYFDETPGWGLCWKIDIAGYAGSVFNTLHRISLIRNLELLPKISAADDNPPESLFEHVARHNGPLDDYHPQMILQCLLWEKIELVKNIIVNLAKNLESGLSPENGKVSLLSLSFRRMKQPGRCVIGDVPYITPLDPKYSSGQIHMPHRPRYSVLFSVPEVPEESTDEQFSRSLVERLMERLEEKPLPHLTPKEHASLLVLIQTTVEIEEQRRALDSNGLRYVISMRGFYILNHLASEPSTPASNGAIATAQLTRRERLRYRDIIWAFHSESQELLLSTSIAACGGKMCWTDARALGVFLWLHSGESLKAHMEVVARNEYMARDNRDPTACSLFYFALGKVKLVQGLWRQAAWHKEQQLMLKFLNNDFSQPRWRTAALKNAFALLSKRRFKYAAAFFLLGGSLKDAVNVCIKNLSDFQLAVAIARVVEQGDDGPVLDDILNNTVLPTAFKDGNRWLASWAFWLLRRRDLAVRILVTPLQDIAVALDVPITEIGDPHYDDPSLALLFSQLKSKTLQTAQGTSEISGRTEFNFVLQIARVFCRMGCHVLALDLVRSWSFQRPSTVAHDGSLFQRPPSPISTRFALEPALRRRSSILIDVDVTTAPPTRRASPTLSPIKGLSPTSSIGEEFREEGDLVARKAGIGSLMKSAKQDVKVPEFDMNAFF